MSFEKLGQQVAMMASKARPASASSTEISAPAPVVTKAAPAKSPVSAPKQTDTGSGGGKEFVPSKYLDGTLVPKSEPGQPQLPVATQYIGRKMTAGEKKQGFKEFRDSMGGKAKYRDPPKDDVHVPSRDEMLDFSSMRANLLKNPKLGFGGVSAADRVADYDRQIASAKKKNLSSDHWRVKYIFNRMAQDEAKLHLHEMRGRAKGNRKDPSARGAQSYYDFLQQEARVGGTSKRSRPAGAESAPRAGKTGGRDDNMHYSKSVLKRVRPAGGGDATTTFQRTSTPKGGVKLNLAQLASIANSSSESDPYGRNAKSLYLGRTSRTQRERKGWFE